MIRLPAVASPNKSIAVPVPVVVIVIFTLVAISAAVLGSVNVFAVMLASTVALTVLPDPNAIVPSEVRVRLTPALLVCRVVLLMTLTYVPPVLAKVRSASNASSDWLRCR